MPAQEHLGGSLVDAAERTLAHLQKQVPQVGLHVNGLDGQHAQGIAHQVEPRAALVGTHIEAHGLEFAPHFACGLNHDASADSGE